MRRWLLALAAMVLVAVGLVLVTTDRAEAEVYRNYGAYGDSITAWPNSYRERADVRGVGVGSACLTTTCPDGLNVFTWWPPHIRSLENRPKVAVFMIGTNDYTVSSVKQITTAMRRLVEVGQGLGVRVVFGTITPAPTGSFWNVGQSGVAKSTRLAVNDWIRDHDWLQGPEYARAIQCPDRDMCPRFVDPEWNDVHGNGEFHATMARVLLDWIEADR